LEKAVRGYWSYKISAVTLLLLLFFGSVVFMDNVIDSNSDAAVANVDLSADLSASYTFQEYYKETNQSQNSQKVEMIRADLLNDSRTMERGKYYQTALIIGFAVKQVDPYYPVPCLETTEDCTLYFDQDVTENLNSKLSSVGTEENLRSFAETHNLSVQEQFYTNYSTNQTGRADSTYWSDRSQGGLDTLTYVKNSVYLILLGLVITTVAASIHQVVTGDEA